MLEIFSFLIVAETELQSSAAFTEKADWLQELFLNGMTKSPLHAPLVSQNASAHMLTNCLSGKKGMFLS